MEAPDDERVSDIWTFTTTKDAGGMTALALRQSVAVARRILTEYWRQRRSLIFWAAFPTLMLLLFGSIYRNQPSMKAGFDTTPAGILIGAALFFSCLGGTVSIIVAERERRTLRRLLVSPLDPVAYFLGIASRCRRLPSCRPSSSIGLGLPSEPVTTAASSRGPHRGACR